MLIELIIPPPALAVLGLHQNMKDIATENFQRICEAYEILSDERKRQIYDIYGMEGLTSGLELGPKLNKAEEIKEELERLRRRKEMEKVSAHVQPSGSILANLSLPQFLKGGSIMRGMAMSSELQSQISKRNAIAIGGNLAVNGNAGGGAASVMLRHQISSVSSIEFMASTGLRALIGVQTSRNLSLHSTATMGITMSLRDGSINLSNSWTRQLSDTSSGNIQLVLGPESSVAVGWQKKEEKMSAAGEIKIGTSSFGASAHYTHRFSTKSHGRIAGRVGSTMLELEVGGGRKISQFSTVRMLYSVGIQGIFWKFELHRGRQKLIVPILLSRHLNAVFATGAFVIPTSLYFFLKTFIIKPYYLKREKQKMLENMEKTSTQVQEARAAAEKAQQLLQNVANRKRSRQLETDGLVITKAVYGSKKSLNKKRDEAEEANDELASQVIDVTLPLNFLANDSGQLKLHEGVKKSGIMGFCDPCPGEPKQLRVEYTYHGDRYESMLSYPLKIRDSLKRIRKSQSLLAVPKEARDPKDDQIVQSFRKLLLLEGHLPGKHSDYHTLLRFLRMRDFDLMKAKDMFLQYLKWREEFEVDTIVKEFKFEEYKDVKKCYPHGFHGVDKYGRPLYIERVGMVDLNAFLQITTIDRFMKYHVSEQEKTLNWRYPACSVSAKKHIASTTSILDVKGVTLHQLFIVNAGSGFRVLWKALMVFLDARTLAKIQVLGSNYHSILAEVIDPSNLPSFLGGNCTCSDYGGCLLNDKGPWNDPEITEILQAQVGTAEEYNNGERSDMVSDTEDVQIEDVYETKDVNKTQPQKILAFEAALKDAQMKIQALEGALEDTKVVSEK
ncbi:hypothetical protein CsSME_00044722 [Camellia sinensis var. sinensis]